MPNESIATMEDDIDLSDPLEDDIDLSDPLFEDMDMSDSAERRKFLEVCRESFGCSRSNTDFNDWKVFVSLLLQMELVDLDQRKDFCEELQIKTRRNMCLKGSWSYDIDDDGRIYRLRLEPTPIKPKIPATIRRLDRLKRLYITGQNVNSLPLKELCLLPHLEELKISFQKGLKVIADLIRSEKPFIKSNSLRSVWFLGHDRWGELEWKDFLEDPETEADLLTFLDFFVTVGTVKFPDGIDDGIKTACDKDWKYALIKNAVGRRFVQGRSDDSYKNSSLWPIILRRAQHETDQEIRATGIYYLLREGPGALIDRGDLERNADCRSVRLAKYTRKSIAHVQEYLAEQCNGRQLPKIHSSTPFSDSGEGDHESSTELNPMQFAFYKEQTLILRRVVALGRADIDHQVTELESHLASPRQKHLETIFRIYSYLKLERISAIPVVEDHDLGIPPLYIGLGENGWVHISPEKRSRRFVNDPEPEKIQYFSPRYFDSSVKRPYVIRNDGLIEHTSDHSSTSYVPLTEGRQTTDRRTSAPAYI